MCACTDKHLLYKTCMVLNILHCLVFSFYKGDLVTSFTNSDYIQTGNYSDLTDKLQKDFSVLKVSY